MPSHVALLRGVNVGGRKLAMADLRDAVASLGFADVATYIQSGNVVFSAARADGVELAARIAQAVEERTGVAAGVVVLTRDELARALSENPYADESNPKALHLMFFGGAVPRAVGERLDAAQAQVGAKGSGDTIRVLGRILYLHTPDGYGRSELAQLVGRVVARGADGVTATARNLATARKLLELLDA